MAEEDKHPASETTPNARDSASVELSDAVVTATLLADTDKRYNELLAALAAGVPWTSEMRNELKLLEEYKGTLEQVNKEPLKEGRPKKAFGWGVLKHFLRRPM